MELDEARLDSAPAAGADHEVRPWPGSVYSTAGRNTGLRADLMNKSHYPVTGICTGDGCGQVIRLEGFYRQWEHTGRMPGEPEGQAAT